MTAPPWLRERAHPRSRGEHRRCSFANLRALGSSPLARGALTQTAAEAWFAGLIPARAGSTSANAAQTFLPWAHPRSRGEHMPPW